MKMPLELDNGHWGILRRMCMAPWPKCLKSGPWHGPIIMH